MTLWVLGISLQVLRPGKQALFLCIEPAPWSQLLRFCVLVIVYFFQEGRKWLRCLLQRSRAPRPHCLPWALSGQRMRMVVRLWRRSCPPLKVGWPGCAGGVTAVPTEVQLWLEPVFLAATGAVLSLSPPLPGEEMRGLSLSPRISSPPGPPGDLEDEEGLKHLQQVWGACLLQGCPTGSLACPPAQPPQAAQTRLSFWTSRRQRSWWPLCRTAPWRRSSSLLPCRRRAYATPQPSLPFPSAMALPESGSTRTHRGKSKVVVGSRLLGLDVAQADVSVRSDHAMATS